MEVVGTMVLIEGRRRIETITRNVTHIRRNGFKGCREKLVGQGSPSSRN